MALNVNTSIVDYLSSVGQASDFNSRSTLAGKYGITGYQGTADQNLKLLGLVKSGSAPASQPAAVQNTPAPVVSAPTTSSTPRLDYVSSFFDKYQASNDANAAKTNESRQKLIDYYASLTPVTERYTNLSNEQGLPAQQQLVNDLTTRTMKTEDLIDQIEPSVNSRVGDFFVNEGDRASIVSREQKPMLTELNKLLRNKQYEEVGLAGKQNLVKELLAYSLEEDKQRAKPYELGVDFSEADQKLATDLFDKLLSTSTSAFNADTSAAEDRANTANDQAFQLTKMEKQLANDLVLQNAKEKTSNKTTSNKLTDNAWTDILKGSKTEYDVWQRINDNQTKLKAMGVNVDDLWKRHKSLADSVGTGGKIQGDTTIDFTNDTDVSSYYP